MATFNKVYKFIEDLTKGVHDLSSDQIKVYLSNSTPLVTHSVKADVPEITSYNGYTAGGASITPVFNMSNGSMFLNGSDIVWTATAGGIGPFRFAILYNDTSPSDSLLGYWDYGTSITVGVGETFTIDFGVNILTAS